MEFEAGIIGNIISFLSVNDDCRARHLTFILKNLWKLIHLVSLLMIHQIHFDCVQYCPALEELPI